MKDEGWRKNTILFVGQHLCDTQIIINIKPNDKVLVFYEGPDLLSKGPIYGINPQGGNLLVIVGWHADTTLTSRHPYSLYFINHIAQAPNELWALQWF